MSTLGKELDTYLALRRSLGFDLGTSARYMRRLVEFAQAEGDTHLTAGLVDRWRLHFGRASPQTWSARLGAVRLFARWLQARDPAHEVPAAPVTGRQPRRPPPHIYTGCQVADIVARAAALPSVEGIRGLTFSTLFGLVAATGLRISEALALDVGDADLAAGVLTVRRGKRGRQRLVPLHPSATARLGAYLTERDRLLGGSRQALFVGENGARVTDCTARYNFVLACEAAGLRSRGRSRRHGRGPRVHDLRHTFAVRVLVAWYRAGMDPPQQPYRLSTYLGHQVPAHTYWYVEAVPELLALAAARAEATQAGEGR